MSKKWRKAKPMQPFSYNPAPAARGNETSSDSDERRAGRSTLDFLWKAHDCASNDIRFADTKAVMVVAVCSAFISGMFAARLQRFIKSGLTLSNIGVYETLMGVGTTVALL